MKRREKRRKNPVTAPCATKTAKSRVIGTKRNNKIVASEKHRFIPQRVFLYTIR